MIWHSRLWVKLTGKTIPMPRYSEGLIIDQYVNSSMGPIFQSAGDSKYLHQATAEVQLLGNDWRGPALVGPTFFGSGCLGALATNQMHRPEFWLLSGAITLGVTFFCIIPCSLLTGWIGIMVWGKKIEVMQDVGLQKSKDVEDVHNDPVPQDAADVQNLDPMPPPQPDHVSV